MQRNLHQLASTTYDLVVIGGGICGAFIAWDAVLRGLKVALIERSDFGAETSAASGKMIHGGIRFLQYGAIHRVRESLQERLIFLKHAPHMITEIPFLIPTYQDIKKSKALLNLAFGIYKLIGFDQKAMAQHNGDLNAYEVLSKRSVIDLNIGVRTNSLTGGILYKEFQMHHPERLTLSVIRSAQHHGAQVANYAEACKIISRNNTVTGISLRDNMTGSYFDIKCSYVVNSAGPWSHSLLSQFTECRSNNKMKFSKGVHIVTKSITQKCAIALTSEEHCSEALVQRGGRHYFIIPWRGFSLIGTTHSPFRGVPGDKIVSEDDIATLISEVNSTFEEKMLRRSDVRYGYGGLYPDMLKKKDEEGYQGARNDRIVDHGKDVGLNGLLSAVCVKYTTARRLARRCVDIVFSKMGYANTRCLTDRRFILGGNIENLPKFAKGAVQKHAEVLEAETINNLILNYGTEYERMMNDIRSHPELGVRILPGQPIIFAQIKNAVENEMAVTLEDIVLRRTGLGTIGYPGDGALAQCAKLMGALSGWNSARHEREIDCVKARYRSAA